VNPITHGLIGWSIACSVPLNHRERGFITLASVIPDLDGLGVLIDFAYRHTQRPTDFWGTYHHLLGHNLTFAIVVSLVALLFSTHRWRTSGLVFLSFHLHLLGDVLGGRGPDGDSWPIPYLAPFTDSVQWVWAGQWALNAWPNFLITSALLIFSLYTAWCKGISPLEFISPKNHRRLVLALRSRFGDPVSKPMCD